MILSRKSLNVTCNFVALSLENYSDKIRWSFDFWYQSAEKPASFYGLKDPIVFRTKKDPHLELNWDAFNKVNRNVVSSMNPKAAQIAQQVFHINVLKKKIYKVF